MLAVRDSARITQVGGGGTATVNTIGNVYGNGIAAVFCYAAIGVIDTPSVVNVNVFVLTQAWDAVRAADHRKLPAVDASHTLMCVKVSDVPPFVHTGLVPVNAMALDAAAENVATTRVVDPTAAAVAPAEPGSAVCSFTYVAAGAVVAAARIQFSHMWLTFV